MCYALVDVHVPTDTSVQKLNSNFQISTYEFLCTKLISILTILVIPSASNMPVVSQFGSEVSYSRYHCS